MKKEIKVSAKTVEEAIAEAAKELNVPASELEYTVVTEPKKGFWGIGATDAEIVATHTPAGETRAIEFIKTVIADMGLNVEVSTRYGENGALIIEVNGADSGVLIGHHGDTLDALQYLAGLAANRREVGENGERAERGEYIKIALDIAGYREKREETLRALARRQAERVLKYKRSVMLEPMNPYERRIIHSEIQQIENVNTHSVGSDDNRKVVVTYEGADKVDRRSRSRRNRDNFNAGSTVAEYDPMSPRSYGYTDTSDSTAEKE